MNSGVRYSSLLLLFAGAAVAHEGHDHAPGEDSATIQSGPVEISEAARKNLRLVTFEATISPIEETLNALGQIRPLPGKAAAVSSRVSGRVSSLLVNEGQSVKAGQSLIEVESRQLGDPPPRVTYKAPFDGVVIDQHVLLGTTVEPDNHLMEVVDLSEVYVEGRIHEGQIAQVKVGQRARVRVEAYPKDVFEGSVELMSGALDPETLTLKVWVRIKNRAGMLRPNMRATLSIITAEAGSGVGIPHRAILGDAGELFVFVQSEENPLLFERRSVVLGLRDDNLTEIIEGIYPGDKVVVDGAYQLQYVPPKKREEEK